MLIPASAGRVAANLSSILKASADAACNVSDDRYGCYALKRGDNDKRGVWGGIKPSAVAAANAEKTNNYVALLQTDLQKIGIYTAKIDGDFGRGTESAVKRFQWNAANVGARIKNGKATPIAASVRTFSAAATGVADPSTALEIARWLKSGYVATGDLVRVDVTALANMKGGTGKIVNASVLATEVVVSSGMLEDIKAMNAKAGELGIEININQTLRVAGVPVRGAVVTPAKKSQHLIGHAIDCNLVDGDSWNNSKNFKDGKETENAKKFIKAMTDRGMRWGGNWTKVDTPHFDRQVSSTTDDYDHKFFFNQRTISAKQPIIKGKI